MFETRIESDSLYWDRSRHNDLYTFYLSSSCDAAEADEITIGVAEGGDELNGANALINDMYSWRGYGADHHVPTVESCVIFTASSRDALIGTVSLTVDSPDGLACDATFKEELEKFRYEDGARICELTKFAFDTSKPSMKLLASMFHIIFIYGTHKYNCTDLFIEVNPRHRRFYEAMLGFKTVGAPKTNDAVGAPSHLMRLKVSDIGAYIDRHTGPNGAGVRSLYPYFLSTQEEIDIYMRLVGRSLDNLLTEGSSYSNETEELIFDGDGGGVKVPSFSGRYSKESHFALM
jgi:hypothetical protein